MSDPTPPVPPADYAEAPKDAMAPRAESLLGARSTPPPGMPMRAPAKAPAKKKPAKKAPPKRKPAKPAKKKGAAKKKAAPKKAAKKGAKKKGGKGGKKKR